MNDTLEYTDDRAPATPAVATNAIDIGALLRVLGTFATVLAAVVFMFQGLDAIALALRNWFYVGFTAALAGGGLLSLYVFGDRRGARLFFALAAAMVPVQAAQLGGMLHELWVGGQSPVPSMFQAAGVDAGQLVAVALASALVLIPSAWMGFRVLMREHSARLTAYYATAGLLLLSPARDSFGGVAVLALLGAGLLLAERYVFARNPAARTWEGQAVRAMFAMPLLIAAVRTAFYVDAITFGIGVLASAGLLGLWLARSATARWFAETCRALATLCLSLAWVLAALAFVFPVWDAWTAFFVVLPGAALALVVGHYAPGGGAGYRGMALLALAVASLALVGETGELVAWLLALGAGLAMSAVGALYRERLPLFGGALQAVVALLGVVALSLESIAIDTWLALALAGVALVLLSSVVERFGAGWLQAARRWGRSDG